MARDWRVGTTIAVVTAASVLSPMGMQIIVPALPALTEAFGASIARTQWTASAYSIMLAVAMLAYGPLADRIGRRTALVIGMVIFLVGAVMAWFATSLEMLIVARILQALGAGAGSIIARVVAADYFRGDDLTRVLAYMTMAIVLGPMFAPAVGGLLIESFGWRSIFLLLAVLGTATLLLAVAAMPADRPPTAAGPAGGESTTAHPRHYRRTVVTNVGILVAIQVGVYAFIAASPYLIIQVMGHPATIYGFVFIYITLGFLGGTFLSARLVRRFGSEALVRFGVGSYAVGAVLLLGLVSAGAWTLPALAGPVFLLTFANGITQPNCLAAVLSGASERQRGRAASITGFAQIMAGAVGLQLMGFLQGETPVPMAIVIAACGAAAWAGMALRRPR